MKKFKNYMLLAVAVLSLPAINSCKKDIAADREVDQPAENKINQQQVANKPEAENISVVGGGTFAELGEITTYSFNAAQKRNGTTTGHFMFHFRAADASIIVALDCLRLFGDNKATMSGLITKIYGKFQPEFPAPPFIYIGGRVSFTVQDNGEGNDASPDLVSDIGQLVPEIPASCADDFPVYLAGANVQINK